ncbi:MAG: amidohydrolase family protein [Pseudomonadota bacterium]
MDAGNVFSTEFLFNAPGDAPDAGPSCLHVVDGRFFDCTPITTDDLADESRGLATLPAIVDAHDHGRGLRTLAFGTMDEPLESWILDLMNEPVVPPYLRAAVAFGRMVEGGIAAANHCHNTQTADLIAEAEEVARAARDVGIRVAFAVPILDRNPVVYGDHHGLLNDVPETIKAALQRRIDGVVDIEQQLEAVDAIAEFEHDLFEVQYGPRGLQWMTDQTMETIAEASAKTGRRIHMHLFETQRQRVWADRTYPSGPIKRMDATGFLSPRLTVAHGIWLNDDEISLMAERGVTVSVNSSSNLRLRSGMARVDRFIEEGLCFGVGLDSMAFDDDEDMLREFRLFWRLHRDRHAGMNERLDLARAFRAAAIDGRRTVVRDGDASDKDGSTYTPFAPKSAADFMQLDWRAIAHDMMPGAIEPAHLIAGRMTKRHLRRLVVAGRSVVVDGRCTGIDLPAAEVEILERALHDWKRGPADRRADRDALKQAIKRYYEAM